MNIKEMLILIFKKDIGILKRERKTEYGEGTVHTLEFVYKNKITIKILLFELDHNRWVVHHELSKENPFLLKRIARACNRIQRLRKDENSILLLSNELMVIKTEMFIKTAFKSSIQNLLSKHTLFSAPHTNVKSHQQKQLELKVNEVNAKESFK